MSSKARLIECIDNIIIDEQNYIKEKAMDLKNKGYTVLDLHLSRLIQPITIVTNTNINQSVITINSAVRPTNGNIFILV